MNIKINKILSLPRSLFINIHLFGLKKGIKMPILISNNFKTKGLHRGAIKIEAPLKFGMIEIGFWGTIDIQDKGKGLFMLEDGGSVIFKGKARIGSGSSIRAKGTIEFGKEFKNNKNLHIGCVKKIIFHDDVLIGYDVWIIDNDGGHPIYDLESGKKMENSKPIEIGEHVWIGAFVDIRKGVKVSRNSVVAWKSLVTKKFETENCIIAGTPAKIIKENINWKLYE